ncbi:MAG: hypothetical protein LBC18_00320 [Opitutaceae bacterium]|jgi:hypothetical protein|nr:hypothetical protein [Opitutaceae bacterium]
MKREFEGIKIVNEAQAKALGCRSLTTRINPVSEADMLRHFITDMQRGGIRFALVKAGEGVEVWRGAPKTEDFL